MDYGTFRCRHCRKLRRKRTQDQSYCRETVCQKARKNRWRRQKYAEDADYRDNQRDSTDAWLKRQGGAAAYHQEYRRRRKKPAPSESAARYEAEGETVDASANSDAGIGETQLVTGIYAITRITEGSSANSDAFLAKIDVIPVAYHSFTNIDPLVQALRDE